MKLFQRDVHLQADGIVGPKLLPDILFAGMGGRILQRNRWDRNRATMYITQRSLKDLSYYTGNWMLFLDQLLKQ